MEVVAAVLSVEAGHLVARPWHLVPYLEELEVLEPSMEALWNQPVATR